MYRRELEELLKFKLFLSDTLPIILLIPLTVLYLTYKTLPSMPKSVKLPTIHIVVDWILLFVALLLVPIISRYDAWRFKYVILGSDTFRKLAKAYLTEYLLAAFISVLGLPAAYTAKYWPPIIPFVAVSYTMLAILCFRLRIHMRNLNERIRKLTVRLKKHEH